MGNINRLIQPLEFKSSYDYTISNRHDALRYYTISPLIVNKDQLIPFEITRYKSDDNFREKVPITEVNIIDLNRNTTTNVVAKCSFAYGFDDMEGLGMKKEYVLYTGGTNLALRQGLYRIHLKDNYVHAGYNTHDWYSQAFRIRFPDKTVKFEFRLINGKGVNDLWSFPKSITGLDFNWKLELESFTYSNGEYDSYSESVKDANMNDVFGFEMFRKLRICLVEGDDNILDCLQLIRRISNMENGEVIMTDEVGYREYVKINDITVESVNHSNYKKIMVTYSIKDADVFNTEQNISFEFVQPVGPTPTVEPYGGEILRSNDKEVLTHDKVIKIR
jgi:hypothetical protein